METKNCSNCGHSLEGKFIYTCLTPKPHPIGNYRAMNNCLAWIEQKQPHKDYLKLQGVEILPARKERTGIVGLDKIEPLFVPVIPMYEREG